MSKQNTKSVFVHIASSLIPLATDDYMSDGGMPGTKLGRFSTPLLLSAR